MQDQANPQGLIQWLGPNGETKAEVKIFGLKEIPMSRNVDLDIKPIQTAPQGVATYSGQSPPEFNISFELIAGTTIRTREEIHGILKTLHAMASASGVRTVGDAKILLSPPKVRLIVRGHINCTGVLKSLNTSSKGPWVVPASGDPLVLVPSDSEMYPSEASIDLIFSPMSGYTPGLGGTLVEITNFDAWTSDVIAEGFYRNDG